MLKSCLEYKCPIVTLKSRGLKMILWSCITRNIGHFSISSSERSSSSLIAEAIAIRIPKMLMHGREETLYEECSCFKGNFNGARKFRSPKFYDDVWQFHRNSRRRTLLAKDLLAAGAFWISPMYSINSSGINRPSKCTCTKFTSPICLREEYCAFLLVRRKFCKQEVVRNYSFLYAKCAF